MEKVIYLIMTRETDRYSVIYADQCEKTERKDFFINNPQFKCWISNAGSEDHLYLSIYPMWEASKSERRRILEKIILRFKPVCNEGRIPPEQVTELPPDKEKSSRDQDVISEKKIPSFVDPNKDPRSYIRRYLRESKYKDWFERNYPSLTIYEAVGVSKEEFLKLEHDLESEPPSVISVKPKIEHEPELESPGPEKEESLEPEIKQLQTRLKDLKTNLKNYKQKIESENTTEPQNEIQMNCPCCGSQMKQEKELDHSFLMKCTECGISDTRLKS